VAAQSSATKGIPSKELQGRKFSTLFPTANPSSESRATAQGVALQIVRQGNRDAFPPSSAFFGPLSAVETLVSDELATQISQSNPDSSLVLGMIMGDFGEAANLAAMKGSLLQSPHLLAVLL